ncbi:MAG: AarF/ABC1/UbiB kinase family protein [Ancalomicrobiaceae bacterium]|nr:AarF/ABC1/UbiB kinase family protein [Ancalomicrobiaceae bacterium]
MSDIEANRLSSRVSRYARVGAGVGTTAARIAGARLFGEGDTAREGQLLAATLGSLKGPLMKVAQMLATIPDIIPAEWATEFVKLQAHAPPMGRVFVKRRMAAELGPDWQARFSSFDFEPAHAASLGQVHRAIGPDGRPLAVKLQYPDMASAVEADLGQLNVLFSLVGRLRPQIDTRNLRAEIADRLREELDYARELKHMRLYRAMLADEAAIRVPEPVEDLSTGRLLSMGWLEGRGLLAFKSAEQHVRDHLAEVMFRAWWKPFCRYGIIHGDPHLGNYAAYDVDGRPAGINLLDFGCIRVFPPDFVAGVIEHYRGHLNGDRARIEAAYAAWGFRGLTPEMIDTLDIWAKFLYGPLIDDRKRRLAEGVTTAQFGRREAAQVADGLSRHGTVTPPAEFLFMDRAAIGLGAVFLHLDAELNFHRLFEEFIEGFDRDALAARQAEMLADAGFEVRPA